jgi:hypothetical protein
MEFTNIIGFVLENGKGHNICLMVIWHMEAD